MAFGTTERLPTIVTYEQAKKKYETTTPIRGSEKDMEGGLRPLAARRDKHLYIRQGEAGSFELVCYQSPVITIHPDDRIVIQPYHQSAYTCDFIRNILWNTRRPSIRNHRGKTLIAFEADGDGQPVRKYLLDTNDKLTLKYDPLTNTFETIEQPDTYVWKPNWRKFKALTLPYSEFAEYYKNMVGLLMHETPDDGLPDDPFVAKHAVTVQMETLVDLFGTTENPHKNNPYNNTKTDYLNTARWRLLLNKPVWAAHTVDMEHSMVNDWRVSAQTFLTNVSNDQPEAEKYAAFHRATFGLILAEFCYVGRANIPLSWPSITISKSAALGAFKNFLLFAFAEEVIEKVPSTPGKVPTTNYGNYLFNKGW